MEGGRERHGEGGQRRREGKLHGGGKEEERGVEAERVERGDGDSSREIERERERERGVQAQS